MNQDLKSSKAEFNLKSSEEQIKSSIDKYLIDLNDYEIKRDHKESNHGILNYACDKYYGMVYVAKTFLLKYSLQNRSSILHEISNLFLQHPSLFHINGFSYEDFEGNNNLTIITNYMKNGSISSNLPINTNSQKQIILIGITRAMMLLHEQNIIHRNLKAENVLIDDNYHPLLNDF